MREESKATGAPHATAGYDVTPLREAEVNELAKSLSDEERRVILYQGTEAPFCGNLLANNIPPSGAVGHRFHA